jgi:hypothetical protein
MESVSSFLRGVGGLAIAALIVLFAFFLYNNQKESANEVVEQTNRVNVQVQEAEWTQYEGTDVTGSEVINVIKRMSDSGTYVSVNNGSGEVFYIYSGRDLGTKLTSSEEATLLSNAKKRGNAAYISPGKHFIGTVDRDDTTDAILGIKFEPAP